MSCRPCTPASHSMQLPAPGAALNLPVGGQPMSRPVHSRQRTGTMACRAAVHAAAQGPALTCLAGRAVAGAHPRGGALGGACGAAGGARALSDAGAVITTVGGHECAATLHFSHAVRLGVVVRGADLVPLVALTRRPVRRRNGARRTAAAGAVARRRLVLACSPTARRQALGNATRAALLLRLRARRSPASQAVQPVLTPAAAHSAAHVAQQVVHAP